MGGLGRVVSQPFASWLEIVGLFSCAGEGRNTEDNEVNSKLSLMRFHKGPSMNVLPLLGFIAI